MAVLPGDDLFMPYRDAPEPDQVQEEQDSRLVYPTTPEEAKSIIRFCNEQKAYNRYFIVNDTKLVLLVFIIFLVIAFLMWIWTDSIEGFLSAAGLMVLVCLMASIPLLHQIRLMRSIRSGSYFNNKTDEELVSLGQIFFDTYTRYKSAAAERPRR